MRKHYIFGILMSIIMTSCAGNGTDQTKADNTAENEAVVETAELTLRHHIRWCEVHKSQK